jgi:TP901 family phage tail tape measure protein
LEYTIILAKLGNTSTAEATEYLISMLNGFQLEAEDSIDLIDKMINLDNRYATSVSEIASALQRSSASAQQAGVTFDELISYITTVSSVTRQSAESIGVSFRTMFARMQRVKIGAEFDEMGESISDVEKILANAGIQLRDTANSFRPLGDVLDEVASKWDTLGKTQQSQVAEAIAGVRQRENFLVLMQNYNKVLEAQEHAAQSSGLAQERYALYLESVEAAANKAKTAWEEMWQASINTEGIKFLYNLSASIANLITDIGGLETALKILATTLIFVKRQAVLGLAEQIIYLLIPNVITLVTNIYNWSAAMVSLATSEGVAEVATYALKLAFDSLNLSNPVGWIAILVGTLFALDAAIKNPLEKIEKFSSKILDARDAINELNKSISNIKSLMTEYNTLLEEQESGAGLTEAETQKLISVQNELKILLPILAGYWDEYGNFVIESAEALEAAAEATINYQNAQKPDIQADSIKNAEKMAKNLANLYVELEQQEFLFQMESGWRLDEEEMKELRNSYQEAFGMASETFGELSYEGMTAFIDGLKKKLGEDDSLVALFEDNLTYALDAAIKKVQEDPNISLVNIFTDYGKEDIEESAQSAIQGYVEGLLRELGLSESEIKKQMAEIFRPSITSSELFTKELPELREQISAVRDAFDMLEGKEIIGQDKIEELKNFNLVIKTSADGVQTFYHSAKDGTLTAIDSIEEYIDAQIDLLDDSKKIPPIMMDALRAYLDAAEGLIAFEKAQEDAENAVENFTNKNRVASRALAEYNEHGQISIQTAFDLINAGYAQAVVFDRNTGAITINTQVLRQLQLAEIDVAIATQQQALATAKEEGANWSVINSIKARIRAQEALRDVLEGTVGAATDLSNIGGGGYSFTPISGGGGGQDLTQEYNELLRMAVAVIRKQKEEQRDALRQEIEDRKEVIDLQIEQLNLEEERLKDQLSNFKDIIDARKKILEQMQDERDYSQDIAEKNKDLEEIENELFQMQYDDSQEAVARRLKLEEERVQKQNELDDLQYDHGIELQKDALDEQYDLFDQQVQRELDAIESRKEALEEEYEIFKKNIEDRIAIIDDYLEKTGRINQEALAKLKEGSSEFYQQLLKWNRDYGDGLDETVNKLWEQRSAILASAAAQWEYNNAVATGYTITKQNKTVVIDQIPDEIKRLKERNKHDEWWNEPAKFHEGGFVGGAPVGSLKSSEIFAKLFEGEFVATPHDMSNFINNVLPNIIGTSQTNGAGDINVNMNFDVEGNMDKSILPDIEKKTTEALLSALKKRGIRRNANSYGV